MLIELPEHFRAEIDGRAISLSVLSEWAVVLRIAEGREFQPYASYAIVKNEWTNVEIRNRIQRGFHRFETGELSIEISTNPFSLKIARSNSVVFETAKDAAVLSEFEPTTLIRRREPAERIYGMGELGETFDHSDRAHELWNTDDWRRHPLQLFYCMIPFAIHMSEQGDLLHGLFIDNPGRQFHDLGATKRDEARYQTARGDMVVWLIFADSFAEMLQRWTELTGRMNRPPLWALGNQQCRWSYFPEERVREIATNFRTRKIPCDVLYLDIQYMDDFRVFTWDTNRFPNPEKLILDLRQEGFRTITIVDPGIKIDTEYSLYREVADRPDMVLRSRRKKPFIGEVWPGKVHFPDFTHPDMRRIWSDFQKSALLDKGIAGIWNDMNEPSNFIEQRIPNDLVHHDFALHRTHEEIHQVYGQTMAQTSYEGCRDARPDERPFVITRSGWAGIQRYAMVWTGDNESLWESMPFDLMLNLNIGLSGVPLVGCDIGGFGRNCTPELYARWIEWGVFQPFCRTHSAWETRDQEPWAFGAEVEAVSKKMIELRYQLLPYLYTRVAQASRSGLPINQPLVMIDPSDRSTHHISDAFLLGEDLLVAPVLQRGIEKRMVYLPSGNWYHYWSGNYFTGRNWYLIEAPIGEPPLFARAGAVIPMSQVRQHVEEGDWTETFLDIWPDEELHGHLIEDDGVSEAWRDGTECDIFFTGRCTAKEMRLMIGAPSGDYRSPRLKWTVRVHCLPGKVDSVRVDGEVVPFEESGGLLRTTLDDNHEKREIIIALA